MAKKNNSKSIEQVINATVAAEVAEPTSVVEVAETTAESAESVDEFADTSTKATSQHAFAMLSSYNMARREGRDGRAAMASMLDGFPHSIRRKACLLAMKKCSAGSAVHDALKALHDAQPAIEATRGGGVKLKNNIARAVKVRLNKKTGVAYASLSLPGVFVDAKACLVTPSEDGLSVTITRI